MSKYLSIAVKFFGGILGLSCLMAIAPIADAGEYTPAGAFGIGKDESALEGGKAADNKGSEANRPRANRLFKIRAAQMQSQLEADRNAYHRASERVQQAQAQSPQSNPNSTAPRANRQADLAARSCTNPNLASANHRSTELATAKAAQTQAALKLAQTQTQVRQFLASVKEKRNALSSTHNLY